MLKTTCLKGIPPQGLYLGEAAVSTHDGVCHAIAIKAIENDIDIEIAGQDVIPSVFCELPGEEFSDSDPEYSTLGSQGYLSSYAERVERVKKSMHLSHLNDEVKNYSLRWAEDYADNSHLNGERLSSTIAELLVTRNLLTILHFGLFQRTSKSLERRSGELTLISEPLTKR